MCVCVYGCIYIYIYERGDDACKEQEAAGKSRRVLVFT